MLAETVTDISALWRRDLVGFALGCSYSFEEALIEAGLRLRHVERGMGPARYTSTIQTEPAGRFGGAMVVTMRPFKPADAIRAIQVTSRFPMVHGAPVHIGLPHLIGIDDLAGQSESPYIAFPDDEIPLFWACGVTPQVAVQTARAGALHHPCAGPHADHRPAQREPRRVLVGAGPAPGARRRDGGTSKPWRLDQQLGNPAAMADMPVGSS